MRFRSMLSASAGLAVAVLGVYPGIASGQETAEATLEVTSTSEEAKAHFWVGLDEVENIFFSRSATRLEQALALDEDFGLARALYGFGAPGLSDEERVSEINRGLVSLVDGSVPEHLLALAWREWSAGNNGSAKAAAKAASELVPDDPHAALFSAWFTAISRCANAASGARSLASASDATEANNRIASLRFLSIRWLPAIARMKLSRPCVVVARSTPIESAVRASEPFPIS